MARKTNVLKMGKFQNVIDRLIRKCLRENISNVRFKNMLRTEFRRIGIPDSSVSTQLVNRIYNMYNKHLDDNITLKSGKDADQRIQELIQQSLVDFENETFKKYIGYRRELTDEMIKGNLTAEEAYQEVKSTLPPKSTVKYKGRNWQFDKLCKFIVRNELQQASYKATDEVAGLLGTDVFEVSAHSNPRPLCAPWQGKLISTGNTRVYVDLNGNEHEVTPVSEIDGYQAGGLFGYNCRHFKFPIVQGFDIPTGADPLELASKRVSRELK